MNLIRSKKGQATIEYIFLLLIVFLISGLFINGLRGFLNSQTGNLFFYLTDHLSSGVCTSNCFGREYIDQ